jgi:hypothetical protein
MACLANGLPTVTTRGRFTTADVILASAGYPAASEVHRVGELAAAIYDDPTISVIGTGEPGNLRQGTREFYLQNFAVEHTVARLLADEDGG